MLRLSEVIITSGNSTINVNVTGAGPRGLSAYETWLALGNTGTKQDFINSQFDEPARVLNENARRQNETTRIENENVRIEAENIRQQQENLRQQEFETNELTRQNNETTRISNEEARQEADILRGQTVEAIEQHYAPRLTSVEGQINTLDADVIAHKENLASYDEYELSANQSVADTVLNTINFDTKIQNGNTSHTGVSNGIITVDEDGIYEICLSVLFASGGATSTHRQIGILTQSGATINGASISGLSIPNLSVGFSISTINKLTAGTSFRSIAIHKNGTAINVLKDISTRIKIRKVG